MVTNRDGQTVSQALNEHTVVKKTRGRKPSITEEQEDEIVRRYLTSKESLAEVASAMGITHSTARRAIARARSRLAGVPATSFIGGGK